AVEKRVAERSTVDIFQEVFDRRRRRIGQQVYINVSEIGLEPDGLGDGSRIRESSPEQQQGSEYIKAILHWKASGDNIILSGHSRQPPNSASYTIEREKRCHTPSKPGF